MRIFAHLFASQADTRKEERDPLRPFRARADAIVCERLADDIARSHPRVERSIRVLENDLHPSTVRMHRHTIEARDIDAVENDAARRGVGQAQDRFARR